MADREDTIITAVQDDTARGQDTQGDTKVNVIQEDTWEEEADKLYEWTQELSYDDILPTPRLARSVMT